MRLYLHPPLFRPVHVFLALQPRPALALELDRDVADRRVGRQRRNHTPTDRVEVRITGSGIVEDDTNRHDVGLVLRREELLNGLFAFLGGLVTIEFGDTSGFGTAGFGAGK